MALVLEGTVSISWSGDSLEESEGKGNEFWPMLEFSASVSVSVSSPGGLDRLAGLPEREKTRTVSSPASLSAKWTFLGPAGVLGADWARKCFEAARGRSAMFGDEVEDLRDGLRGLPLERMMGVLGVRGSEDVQDEL